MKRCSFHPLCEGRIPGDADGTSCLYCIDESSPQQAESTAQEPAKTPCFKSRVATSDNVIDHWRQVGMPCGEDYDAIQDLRGSIADGFAAIRNRVAAGGPSWTPRAPKGGGG